MITWDEVFVSSLIWELLDTKPFDSPTSPAHPTPLQASCVCALVAYRAVAAQACPRAGRSVKKLRELSRGDADARLRGGIITPSPPLIPNPYLLLIPATLRRDTVALRGQQCMPTLPEDASARTHNRARTHARAHSALYSAHTGRARAADTSETCHGCKKKRGGGQWDLKMTRRLPPQIKRTPPAAVTFRESLCHLRGTHNRLPGQNRRGAAGDSSAIHLASSCTSQKRKKNATPKLLLLHTHTQTHSE